jgi:hypothetical protein
VLPHSVDLEARADGLRQPDAATRTP